MIFTETDRLLLRNVVAKDADIMFDYRNMGNCRTNVCGGHGPRRKNIHPPGADAEKPAKLRITG